MVNRLIALLFMSLLAMVQGVTFASEPVNPLDDDFVTASLIVAGPGPAVYQGFGHMALRMQCPSAGLDNVFSFEIDPNSSMLRKLTVGSSAKVRRVAYADFMPELEADNRTVRFHPLNLTPGEERNLWRMLDQAFEGDEARPFCITREQCTSVILDFIDRAVSPGHLALSGREGLSQSHSRGITATSGDLYPWSTLIVTMFAGNEAGDSRTWKNYVTPVRADHWLPQVSIVSADGSTRPLLADSGADAFAAVFTDETGPFEPMNVAIAVGLALLVWTAAELTRKPSPLIRAGNATIAAIETAAGLILAFIVVTPSAFPQAWNWYLLVFSPVPLIVWITMRHRRFYTDGAVWGVYALSCFTAAAAVIVTEPRGQWPGVVLALAIGTRCAVKSVAQRRRS